MIFRSVRLSHLLALYGYLFMVRNATAIFTPTSVKPAHWPVFIENDEWTAGPFVATQFTELADLYGPLINPEGPL